MDDALSDIFRMIRLEACVYFERDFLAPWAMGIEGTGFAQFHVVTRGHCVVETAGRALTLSVGDVVLFPRGQAHVLGDRLGRTPVPGPEVMASLNGSAPYFSAGGPATRVICGHYAYRDRPGHPVIEELPECIHLSCFGGTAFDTIQSLLQLLMGELAGAAPGMTSVAERLAEVLLVQVLRKHFEEQPQGRGFYAGLADRRLARAIARIHRDAASDLALEVLAQEAGMSRSAFALHFKQTTGTTPIEYLTKWRMLSAAELLRAADLPLGHIAEKVGYESEVSFARAFKRTFDVSPSNYRRGT